MNLRRMISRMRLHTLSMWMLNALFPIIILIVYIAVLYGPDTYTRLMNPNKLNSDFWQLDHWNKQEQVFRYINNIINENPDLLLLDETFEPVRDTEDIQKFEYLIIIRKGESIFAVNDFNSEEGIEVMNQLRALENPILPPFGSTYELSNREIFDKVGYSVTRQLDFYFSDGSEGSVFFLPRVVNIPSYIGTFFFNYIIVLLVVYIVIVGLISVRVGYKVSRDFELMINTLGEISRENFNVELPDYQKGPFKVAAKHINEMAKKLQTAQDYRLEMEAARSSFLDTMTHDLKTPLTSIKVQVEALKDGLASNPEVYLNNIEKKVNNIDKMLNELKMFNDLQMDEYKYQLQSIPLHLFVADVLDEWQYDTKDVALICRYNMPKDQEDMVMIDPDQMKRVLINILSNAIKYVKKEPIEIDVQIKTSGDAIFLTISDNGSGVPEAFLESIFEQYFRVDVSRNQNVAGSGLGLAICKKIVESHQGTIRAYNREIGGLSFEIKLGVVKND